MSRRSSDISESDFQLAIDTNEIELRRLSEQLSSLKTEYVSIREEKGGMRARHQDKIQAKRWGLVQTNESDVRNHSAKNIDSTKTKYACWTMNTRL